MALAYKTETITKEEKELVDKLNRIEGRIRGITKMVEDDRQVEDIMMQVTATYESLRVAMKSLVRKHMEEFVSKGLISTNQQKRDDAYNQLINDLFLNTPVKTLLFLIICSDVVPHDAAASLIVLTC